MDYYFKSIGYEQYDSLTPPTIITEIEIIPTTFEEQRDIAKALSSRSYNEVAVLTALFNSYHTLPSIKNVYFNPPATVVLWDDGTKTVVKCQDGDTYSKETGLALCMAKKAMGNSSRKFNDIFKKWIPEEKKEEPKNVYRSCFNCTSRFCRCAKCDEDTLSMWDLNK